MKRYLFEIPFRFYEPTSTYSDMPKQIVNSGGTINYRYFGGARSVKILSSTDREYYIAGMVLKLNGEVKSYQTANGYAVPNSNGSSVDYFYNVKDWLGTNRAVISATGQMVNALDVDPYGKKLPGRQVFASNYEGYRYQFTGHEQDGETGYQYHGARYYSEELGRYMGVDPLASKFANWSTYNYAMDNPIMMLDPTGMAAEGWIGKKDENGTTTWKYDENVNSADQLPEGYTEYADPGYAYQGASGKCIRLGESGEFSEITQTDYNASRGVFDESRYYMIGSYGWREAGLVEIGAVSGKVAAEAEAITRFYYHQHVMEQAAIANGPAERHMMEVQAAEEQRSFMMANSLVGQIYLMSPLSAANDVIDDLNNGNYGWAATTAIIEFTPVDEVADIMRANRSAFRQFKRANGRAGDFADWHHIVEQNSVNVRRFGVEAIQSADNLIALRRDLHRMVTAHYNSGTTIPGFTTTRAFVNTLSFETQRAYNLNYLISIGWNP